MDDVIFTRRYYCSVLFFRRPRYERWPHGAAMVPGGMSIVSDVTASLCTRSRPCCVVLVSSCPGVRRSHHASVPGSEPACNNTPCLVSNMSSGVSMGWAKARGPRVPRQKKLNNLTNLQIFGCELHKNAFAGRAPQTL